MNRVTVQLFATFKERAGVNHVTLELPEETMVGELRTRLVQEFPALTRIINSALVSINRQFAFDGDCIPRDAEIAVFPPVSGGADRESPTIIEITESALELDGLVARITLPATGAACLFVGVVRGITQRSNPHETTHLEYEAYRSMAEVKLRQIADEIRTRWPEVKGIAIVQRIGRLEAGTPTVAIACTAAHRDSGVFEATRYGIDRLKEIVPIWKKEIGPSGEEWVEGEYIPTSHD